MSVAISKYYEHLGDQLDGDAIELAMTIDDRANIRPTPLCPSQKIAAWKSRFVGPATGVDLNP